MNLTAIEDKVTAFRAIHKLEPEWLYNLRQESWGRYNDMPLPERVTNVWRYTKPESFLVANAEEIMSTAPIIPDGSNGHPYPKNTEYAAVGYNREDMMTLVKIEPEAMAKGIIIKNLFQAARENEEVVRRYLGTMVGYGFGKFEALNMALWNNGFFVYVPDNTVIEKPIALNRHPGGKFSHIRLLVVIGRNSQVTLVDNYACSGRGESGVDNGAVEIFAGDSARVKYVNLQRLGAQCTGYITQRARIGTSGSIFSIYGATGGAISKVNAGTILAGRHAESRMSGILFGNKNQHFDYHTMHYHQDNESYSNIDFKVILKDKANSAYTGLIKIEKDTVNNEAYQENRNLLLNKGTKAESIPELEILTDQVRCTHGATMGPIDPQMLFYLKARGIGHEDAVKMIASGFVEPTITQMPNELQEMMRGIVTDKLTGDQR
ncbi:putative FeS assembly protein SufD [Candidatus Zixiibacteriota bacterium]|nr:putative FeS assembly protein SufD [candidate division Zixibacteria bacterium]